MLTRVPVSFQGCHDQEGVVNFHCSRQIVANFLSFCQFMSLFLLCFWRKTSQVTLADYCIPKRLIVDWNSLNVKCKVTLSLCTWVDRVGTQGNDLAMAWTGLLDPEFNTLTTCNTCASQYVYKIKCGSLF